MALLDARWRRARWRQRRDHQRRARRGPVGAVQLLVHPVRPVLRPRPRPRHQGRQRHGVHSAAAGRSALRPRQPHQLHGADPRHRCRPGADGVMGTADDTTARSTPRPRSSTRTRPIPRIPRTRCSCASTRSTPTATGRHRQADRRRQRRHGHLGRGQGAGRRHARHPADRLRTSATCRCCAPTPTAISSAAPTAFPQIVTGVGADGIPDTAIDIVNRRHSALRSPCQRHPHRPRLPRRHRPQRRARRPGRRRHRNRPRTTPATAPPATTTNCSTPTSSPATAAPTRTSA